MINNTYGIKMTDDEIRYYETDAQVVIKLITKVEEDKRMTGNWYLYYAKDSMGKDVVLIAQTTYDADTFWCSADFGRPIYIGEADSNDKRVKAAGDGCSVLTVTERMDGTVCLAVDKYANEIKRAKKEEQNMTNRWYLYYTRTMSGQDRVIIAKTLDEAKEYAAERCDGYSEPVWLAEADKHDIEEKANGYRPSTLWITYKDGKTVRGDEKYADAIAWLKYKLGIGVEPKKTGSIEVRYEDGHTRVFDDVEKYAEVISPLGIKQLYIRDADGRQNRIPLAKIKEYVVDMPNDKKLVKEKITVSRDEMADIIAKMRELEERLKKIQEG